MKLTACPSCGAQFDLSRFTPGARIRCSKCKTVFDVPVAGAVPSPIPVQPTVVAAAPAVAAGPDAFVPTPGGPVGGPVPQPVPAPGRAGDRPAGRPFGGGPGTARRSTRRFSDSTVKSGSKKPLWIGIAAGVLVLGGIGTGLFLKFSKEEAPPPAPVDPSAAWETEYQRYQKSQFLNSPDGQFAVAKFCRENGHPDLYVKHLEEALKLHIGHPETIEAFKAMYADKAKGAGEKDAAAQAELGQWCQDHGLFAQGKTHLDTALTLDPEQPVARKALGFEKVEGEWKSKEEADKLRDTLAAQRQEGQAYARLAGRAKKVEDLKRKFKKQMKVEFSAKDEPPYLIMIENSKSRAVEMKLDEYQDILKTLYSIFYREYAEKLGLTDLSKEVVPIWLWDTQDKYMQHTGFPGNVGGHYDLRNKWLMTFADSSDPYGVLFHEGTHQLVDYAGKLHGTANSNFLWFSEGMATYFESFHRNAQGEIQLLSVNRDRLPGIKTHLRRTPPTHVPLKEFLGIDYPRFWGEFNDPRIPPGKKAERASLYYAEAWSIIYFMYNFKDGVYREKFNDYFLREMNGEGGVKGFRSVFGDIDALEKEWSNFILTLPED